VHQEILIESDSRLNQKLKDSLNFPSYKNWRDSVYNLEMKRTQTYIQDIKPESYLYQWLVSFIQLRYYRDFLFFHKNNIRTPDERLADLFSQIHSVSTDTLHYDLRISPMYSAVVNSLYSNVYQIATIYRSKDRSSVRPNNVVEKITTKKSSSEDPILRNKDLFYSYVVKASNAINNLHLRESVLAHYYSMVLEHQDIDLGLDSTMMLISDSEIKASLVNTYNSYQWRKSNQNSLKVNFEKPTILDDLKDKYKGYVLYIDIWGTWCGPCYENFKYAPTIKKAFENKKVAFIYLCSTCNKEKWEKDIKEYNLDGEHVFLTSEQNATLSKEFKIIGVPRFIIIDKKGKIVDDNATRPYPTEPMQKKLIDELSKYLQDED
jgi:thiol-disulfide isomerase/thioredoxin